MDTIEIPTPQPGCDGDPLASITERWADLLGCTKSMCALMRAFNSSIDIGYAPMGLGEQVWAELTTLSNLVDAARISITPAIVASGRWKTEGSKSPEDWLAGKTGSSTGKARSQLETGKNLRKAPGTQESFLNGQISAEQADTIADAVEANPAAEDDLLDQAKRDSLKNLKDEAARRKAEVEDIEERERRLHRKRYVRQWTDKEGAWNLRARGPLPTGSEFMAELEGLIDQQFKKNRKSGVRGTRDNYAYDALMDLANQHGWGHGTGTGTGNSGGGDTGPGGPGGTGPSNDGIGGGNGPDGGGGTGPSRRGTGRGSGGLGNENGRPSRSTSGGNGPGSGPTCPGSGEGSAGDGNGGPEADPKHHGPLPNRASAAESPSGDPTPGEPVTSKPAADGKTADGRSSSGPTPGGRLADGPSLGEPAPGRQTPKRSTASHSCQDEPTQNGSESGAPRAGERFDDEILGRFHDDNPPSGSRARRLRRPGSEAEQPELFESERPAGAAGLQMAGSDERGRSGTQARPRAPRASERILCVDWSALLRGRSHPGERCELRGTGAVSVAEMRRTVRVSSARLVVTDDDDRVVTVALLGTGAINGRIIPLGDHVESTASLTTAAAASRRSDGLRVGSTNAGFELFPPPGRTSWSAQQRAAAPEATAPEASSRPTPCTVIIRVRSTDLGMVDGTASDAVEVPGLGLVDLDRATALLGSEALNRLVERGIAVRQHIHPGRGPSAAQRIALAWADTTCRVAGCPNQRVEIDHRDPWAARRVTELDNLDPLCAHHHGLKSNQGWAFTGTDGTVFESPSRRSGRGR